MSRTTQSDIQGRQIETAMEWEPLKTKSVGSAFQPEPLDNIERLNNLEVRAPCSASPAPPQ